MHEEIETMPESPKYYEAETSLEKPRRCGDGRPDSESDLGPQMLGGSLFPVVVHALYDDLAINESLVENDFLGLKNAGMGLGVHRDDHGHGSGCGFADNLVKIVDTARNREGEIRELLGGIYQSNKDKLGLSEDYISGALNKAFDAIKRYDSSKIEITGEELIAVSEKANASTEHLTGSHMEVVAYLNIQEATTFNTVEANSNNTQAFNIDRNAIHNDSKIVGIEDAEFIDGVMLVTYIATEMVLVEDKGKDRLPVEIH